MIPKNLKVLVSKTDKCEPSRVWTVQHLVLINFLGALINLNLRVRSTVDFSSIINPTLVSLTTSKVTPFSKKENLINPLLDSHEKLRISKQEKNCTFLAWFYLIQK
jgi:hypothetical protein